MSKRGARGRSPETQRQFQTLLDFSNGPVLPPVAVGTSHNYGATGPTALPREAELDPIQNVMGVVQRINTGLDDSEQRISLSRTGSAVPSRSGSIVASRNPKREPTPDDQLFRNLREATESPTREVHSDRTPTPPIRQAVSTDSSPDIPPPKRKNSFLSAITDSPMYPKPLQQLTNLFSREEPEDRSADRHSSVDNASEASFELERTIHDDKLQRTRPSGRGTNLSKAPRRPSGVQIQATIEEEDEPSSVQGNESEFVEPADQSWVAEAKTLFPSRFQSEPHSEARVDEASLQEPQHLESSSSFASYGQTYLRPISEVARNSASWIGANWIQAAIILLFPLLLIGAFKSNIYENFRSAFPSGGLPDTLPNGTSPTPVSDLRNHMSDMNRQISSLSRELRSARLEQRDLAAQKTSSPYNHQIHSPDFRINFLSPAQGAIVDPDFSSPSANQYNIWPSVADGDGPPLLSKLTRILSYIGPPPRMKTVHEPIAALMSWEEAGDCWCSVKSAQLGVYLGRAVVPEEVVIEHIPMTATLDPASAPKIIEVWARYVVTEPTNDGPNQENSEFSWMSPWGGGKNQRQSEDPLPAKEQKVEGYEISGKKSLHEVVMSSVKTSCPHDDPEDYSDDPSLGPNYYRIGRMFYDIKDLNYRQAFVLSPIIEMPSVRVDKLVFRVKENWGSDKTCLYRVKLYGHL